MELNKEQILSRFTVYKADALFDIDYSLLKERRCPLCFNKLRILRNGTRAFCASKKHRKPFTISTEQLNKLSTPHS